MRPVPGDPYLSIWHSVLVVGRSLRRVYVDESVDIAVEEGAFDIGLMVLVFNVVDQAEELTNSPCVPLVR